MSFGKPLSLGKKEKKLTLKKNHTMIFILLFRGIYYLQGSSHGIYERGHANHTQSQSLDYQSNDDQQHGSEN